MAISLGKANGTTPQKRLERLNVGYMNAMSDYAKLTNDTIHWTVLSTLHEITLEALLPAFKTMLIEILQFAGKDDLSDVEWLALFTLDIDAVSGATVSSKCILKAVENAIEN